MGWLRGAGFGDPGCLPPPSWCDGVLQHLESETHKLARNLSAYKLRIFLQLLRNLGLLAVLFHFAS